MTQCLLSLPKVNFRDLRYEFLGLISEERQASPTSQQLVDLSCPSPLSSSHSPHSDTITLGDLDRDG